MSMETAEFKELLNRYREGKATAEEVAWLESWYMDLGKADKVVMDEAELIEARELIWKQFTEEHQIVTIKRRLWPRIAVAAAAVAAITLGVWFFNSDTGVLKQVQDDVVVNDIAPGRNGATITLANGKVIELSDAKSGVVVGQDLKYSDGVEILKQVQDDEQGGKRTVMLTANTAKAQTYQFTLSDGTKVWLNSDSKISFPAQFSGDKRKILLEGEGYFEVAKDKAHPFVVQTAKQEVEVLGTHFNINSYADEPVVATTLIEGSVRVSGEGRQQMLKPGEQALNSGTAIKVAKADLETAVDWKNNEFYLEKMDFRVAMRKIARWYNVEVIYSGTVPQNLEAGGWIQRSRNLSDVLKAIEATGLAHFKIEGRRLYVNQ